MNPRQQNSGKEQSSPTTSSRASALLRFALAGLLLGGSGIACADGQEPGAQQSTQPDDVAPRRYFTEPAASGLDRHQLTDGRSLIGWKLSDKIYFGRAKKEGATVAVVWEQSNNQRVSLSTDGLKITRRLR